VVRVQHVFKDFLPVRGGIEQHIADVTRSLAGFEFSVLTSSRSRERLVEAVDEVEVVRCPEWARWLFAPVVPGWFRELRHSRAELLHFHVPNPFAEMAFLASGTTVPMVASYYAEVARHPWLARLYGPAQARFLARARAIVASSPVLADAPALRAHRDRVVIVPFGVEPDEWPATPERETALRSRHTGPLVVFLGRLVWYKGVDVLTRAMASVDATLLVVGGGPERPRLERLARRSGLGARVRFMGEVGDDDRAAYYRVADVFVLPSVSRAETFGIAMLEAMSVGTPAICTEVGTGTSWVNRAGESGLVVSPGDPRALAGAIRLVLADEGLRRQLGTGARHRARRHFSKQAMLKGLADLYLSHGGSG
jgi:glycosyltransferase involved in cell wall biosynthesis